MGCHLLVVDEFQGAAESGGSPMRRCGPIALFTCKLVTGYPLDCLPEPVPDLRCECLAKPLDVECLLVAVMRLLTGGDALGKTKGRSANPVS